MATSLPYLLGVSLHEFHYRWEWHLRSSPETLWPLIADTNRFNRDAEIPSIERLSNPDGPAPAKPLKIKLFGLSIEWEEEPFEWVRPARFGVARKYRSGPVAELRTLTTFERETEGTHLRYDVWAKPRNIIGSMLIPIQIGIISRRKFDTAVRSYDLYASRGETPPALGRKPGLASGARERLIQIHQELVEKDQHEDLVDHLLDTVCNADDLMVGRLRPYALAQQWNAPRKKVLELCLHAVRSGLLDFRWDVLCPLCRGANESRTRLADLKPEVHCDSCHIDYTANFDRSVELTFRPNPSIRTVNVKEFCIGGPQVTPHIVAQQILPPQSERLLTLPLETGRYRLRTSSKPGGLLLSANEGGPSDVKLEATDRSWSNEEHPLSLHPTLRLTNHTQDREVFILERTSWSDDATTAAEVTALQVFRDLFASEALRPGEQISVGSLTIVFTDLRDSTKLYREIGDAPAFGKVMSHFDVLKAAIAEEDGALIKTMGDAVMAVFRRPISAVRALLSAQINLLGLENTKGLTLKAAIHHGPCIAITLNDRLDYFGSTVNVAARLIGLSRGNDIILSSSIRDDPEVRNHLAQESSFNLSPVQATLKGFETETFELWRLHETGQLHPINHR